jgi:hypothetical protein
MICDQSLAVIKRENIQDMLPSHPVGRHTAGKLRRGCLKGSPRRSDPTQSYIGASHAAPYHDYMVQWQPNELAVSKGARNMAT